jgi:hypothetical protein
LQQSLDGVGKRRTDFQTSPIRHLSLAGDPAAIATEWPVWSGHSTTQMLAMTLFIAPGRSTEGTMMLTPEVTHSSTNTKV